MRESKARARSIMLSLLFTRTLPISACPFKLRRKRYTLDLADGCPFTLRIPRAGAAPAAYG